ncbi:MAG: hypothetical protein ACJ72W_02290 [Actinoallomurus sp.]
MAGAAGVSRGRYRQLARLGVPSRSPPSTQARRRLAWVDGFESKAPAPVATETITAPRTTGKRAPNIALWTIQVLLAAFLLTASAAPKFAGQRDAVEAAGAEALPLAGVFRR